MATEQLKSACHDIMMICDGAEDRAIAAINDGADWRSIINFVMYCVGDRGSFRLLDRLIQLGLTTEDARAKGCIVLSGACGRGRCDVVGRLLALGLTADDFRACRALRYACRDGHVDAVAQLFGLGLTADDVRECDAIYAACDNGQLAVLDLLFASARGEVGVSDLSMDDVRECGAVRAACEGGYLAVLERLISGYPGDPGLTDADAQADGLLQAACASGHGGTVARLLALGATPTAEALKVMARSAADAQTTQAAIVDALRAWRGTDEMGALENELADDGDVYGMIDQFSPVLSI